MPPRRQATPPRSQSGEELITAIEDRVVTTVIATGLSPNVTLGSPFREIIATTQNAFNGATGPGQLYENLKPDFKLIAETGDFARLVNAINQAHERERFR